MNLRIVNLLILFTTSALLTLSLLWAYVNLDPDMGWHLKMGELILSTRSVPTTDPFSYTMASFPFIDHEWLTNVYMYSLHNHIGKLGLAVLFSTYLLLTLFISFKNSMSRRVSSKVKKYSIIILTFLIIPVFFEYFGVRPQVQSWLLFAVLFHFLFRKEIWSKYKLLLIPMMILWVNLHGSFAAGAVTIITFIVVRSFRLRKIEVSDIGVGLLILLSTLFNPYGPRIWEEVWMQVSDSRLRWTIMEWQPAIFRFNPSLLILATLSSSLVWKYRKEFLLEEKTLYLFFLIQGISTTRHIPLWIILQIPLFLVASQRLVDEINPIPMAQERLAKVYKIFLVIVLGVFVFDKTLSIFSLSDYSIAKTYPQNAVDYLKTNESEGQIFSPYNWGGYLIWNYPQKKLFIDGRMPSWRWDTDIQNESNYAMEDYNDILSGELDYKEQFNKYSIDTVLWFTSNEPSFYEKIDAFLMNLYRKLTGKTKESFNLIDSLEKDGWQEVYRDETAVIYRTH